MRITLKLSLPLWRLKTFYFCYLTVYHYITILSIIQVPQKTLIKS